MIESNLNEIECKLQHIKLIEIEGKGNINAINQDKIIALCNQYETFKNTTEYQPLLVNSIKKFVLN